MQIIVGLAIGYISGFLLIVMMMDLCIMIMDILVIIMNNIIEARRDEIYIDYNGI